MTLSKPPLFVLFKPHRPNGIHIAGLEPGVVPVAPYESKLSVSASGSKVTVTRRQLPLVPGYALTYWKAQGQNVSYSLIDPTMPPGRSGPSMTLNQFYVACSRSSGRDHVRFVQRIPQHVIHLVQTHCKGWIRDDDVTLRKQAASTERRFKDGTLFDVNVE